MPNDLAYKRICVTGGAGFLGRSVISRLENERVADLCVPRSHQYDLTDASAVRRLYRDARPDVVIHLAAEVGGIGANQQHPGRFFYANMAMGLNLIEEARRRHIDKFVQVGTVCGYPKFAEVPFREDDLFAGYPEETNAPYGVAKRALSVMLAGYRAEYGLNGVYVVPVNLYGPHDNFDPQTSHVIPALIRKFTQAAQDCAPTVTCWGTGRASREFLYVDDAADGVVTAAALHHDPEPINLGTGQEITIADLAKRIAQRCGFTGEIIWDADKPDGQPRRQLDVTRARERLGWEAKTDFDTGLDLTIAWWRKTEQQRAEAHMIRSS